MRVHLIPFVAVAGLIVITPGVDMALVARNAMRGGRSAALATALGVNLGVATWVFAAALGAAAAIQASQTLFDAVRLGGAVYLIALGVMSLRGSRSSRLDEQIPGSLDPAEAHPSRAAFRQGLATNLLNPKMAVFFTSLLPQFIAHGPDPLPGLLLLGGVFNLLGLVWLLGFACVVARARSVLARPRVRRLQERLTGAVLVTLGLRIAIERR